MPRPAANGAAVGQCDRPTYIQVPFRYVFDSAYDHMVSWIKDGTPPPSAPPILFTDATPPVIARDASGIALGGIRLSEEAVPTAVNTGQNSGAGFCRLYEARIVDFDKDKLASALSVATSEYVAAVKEVTEKNLKAGYILKPDAEATIAAAEKIGYRQTLDHPLTSSVSESGTTDKLCLRAHGSDRLRCDRRRDRSDSPPDLPVPYRSKCFSSVRAALPRFSRREELPLRLFTRSTATVPRTPTTSSVRRNNA